MNVNGKVFITALVIVALLSGTIGYCWKQGLFNSHHAPQTTINLYVFKETPEGIELVYSGNVLTDRIEKKLANIFGFNNETVYAWTYIALGNSTVSQTKNKLDTEATTLGFARANSTSVVRWISSGDYSVNYTKKFTALGDITINAAALHETGVGETADAVAMASLGGDQSFQNNWNCTIVWTITWNAN